MEVGPIKLTSLVVKSAEKPWSHSWLMEIRFRFPKAGKYLTDGCLYIWGKGKRVVWDTQIGDLFCRLPRIPFDVEDLLVHGVVGPRKWLVQPISMMARVLGTKVRGAVVFATFPYI